MTDQPTATTEPKAQQPTENAAGAGFSAVPGSEVVWWRPATVLPEAEDVLIVTNSPLAYYPGGDAADMGARGVAVGCHHDGVWKIWTGEDYQPAAVFWWMPFPSLPAKQWCAMCGKWGNHTSGTCPELHPQNNESSEPGTR